MRVWLHSDYSCVPGFCLTFGTLPLPGGNTLSTEWKTAVGDLWAPCGPQRLPPWTVLCVFAKKEEHPHWKHSHFCVKLLLLPFSQQFFSFPIFEMFLWNGVVLSTNVVFSKWEVEAMGYIGGSLSFLYISSLHHCFKNVAWLFPCELIIIMYTFIN